MTRHLIPAFRAEPIDPDIDLHEPEQRRELSRTHGAVLAVICVGGAIGALARYGFIQAWPTPPGQFPWAVFMINVVGSFLIGVLVVAVTEVWTTHPLVRPFLGVGILGGFTTFSTYADGVRELLAPGTVAVGFAYLAGTLLGALLATLAAVRLTRAACRVGRLQEVEA
ncbi:fluoride efflux transporter FluC [Rhodococcus sp. ACT016]|uniref:fluoride efflux transporter FluC n=1 Tax=Rhodococcus sp. ACT016 TaxID=3134808 RepID=UPI003D2938B3